MPTKTFTIAGVPEYFNLPVLQAIESGVFEANNLSVKWQETPEGTGAMAQALWEEKVDLAIILTEGIVKSITQGNPAKIVKTYVESPLVWGIHVPAASDIHAENDIQGESIAVSRMGSGSHMMAALHAQEKGWQTATLNFHIANNLKGAVNAFASGSASVFFWEKFTTKPWVDEGIFRRVGEFPTPWPCFVVAASASALRQYPHEIHTILSSINQKAEQLMQNPEAVKLIAETYSLLPSDVAEFFPNTAWHTGWDAPKTSIPKILHAFTEIGIIESADWQVEQFIQTKRS